MQQAGCAAASTRGVSLLSNAHNMIIVCQVALQTIVLLLLLLECG